MLERYVNLLQSGEVVAFPTETVYGLGAIATDAQAVRKIFDTKQRPADNPLIVHVTSFNALHDLTAEIPDAAQQLANAFWPGPLTLIFKKKSQVLDIVTAGLPTVAVRQPSHPLARKLIEQTGPLVAPSANTSGKPSPTKSEHVKEDFGDSFPVVEGGETDIGLESTVLDITNKPFQLYRPGGIGQQQIEHILDEKVIIPEVKKVEKPKSPGMKYSHYAPRAAVQWLDHESSFDDHKTLYLLHTRLPESPQDNIISFNGNYDEMARRLFDCFRSADHKGYKKIAVEPFTEGIIGQEPLASALVNRISKAVS